MFIDLDGTRIFFDTVGSHLAPGDEGMEERPTLLCLHGGPGFDHTTLRPYFDRFADTHQVVYIDHRANGRSEGDITTTTLDVWADDIAAICGRLGIAKPVVFGQSFGGMVAMHYAARHPAGPARLILSSTACRMHFDEVIAVMQELGGDEAAAAARANIEDPSPETFARYEEVCLPLYSRTPALTDAAAQKRVIRRDDVTIAFFKNELRTMDLRDEIAGIACPVLVIGCGFDPITPPSCSREIADCIGANARLEVFGHCGHGSYRDDPEGTEKLLREFLAR